MSDSITQKLNEPSQPVGQPGTGNRERSRDMKLVEHRAAYGMPAKDALRDELVGAALAGQLASEIWLERMLDRIEETRR